MTEVEQAVKKIFVNPAITAKVVNALVSNKPAGWSHRSNAPYYKKMYALEVKEAIDKMMVDKNDIIYRYSVWCTDETNISPQTLYNRVNQSIRYLIDCLDPDHKYSEWNELVTVSRHKGLGVVISYIPGFGNTEDKQLKPESVLPKRSKPLWYRKMEEWVEDSDNYEPFVKEGLALSPEEQSEIKIMLSQLSNVQCSVSESYVKIIRLG